MIQKDRILGLDLLRILATYMIVILHLLAFTGLLSASAPLTVRSNLLWFLESACYGAVNCYALISGYIALEARWKPARLMELWLQVTFYTVGAALILELLYPGSVDARVWLDAFTPILSKQYWYFSSYFVLFLFMPFLKQLIHALDAVRLRQLAVTLVLCFSLLPLFMSGDVFSVASGYSPLWLVALYLLGACLRRLDGGRCGRRRYLLWYLLAVTAAWAGKLALDAWDLSGSPPIPHFNSMLVLSYLSPFILLGSLALVRFFSGVRLSSQIGRLVGVLSSASFGVYVIHINSIAWKHCFYPRLSFLPGTVSLPLVLVQVLGAALLVHLICTVIDLVRQQLFRLCRVKHFTEYLEHCARKLWYTIAAGSATQV